MPKQQENQSVTLSHEFVMSDERVNRYGFRVLTDGIDLTEFLNNPVALDNHVRDGRSIGKWTNLRKENGQLLGTLVYNQDNPRAMEIYHDVENGYMSAVSIGAKPIHKSEASEFLLEGQTHPTIVRCMLMECSPTNIPANAGAIKLYDEGMEEIQLSLISTLHKPKESVKSEKVMNKLKTHLFSLMFLLGLELSLSEDSDVENALEKVAEETRNRLKANDDELVKLRKERNQAWLAHYQDKIPEGQQDFFLNSLERDFDGTKALLENLIGKEDSGTTTQTSEEQQPDLSLYFKNGAGTQAQSEKLKDDGRGDWKFFDWMKKDMEGLNKMKVEAPERHAALLSAHQAEYQYT